MGGKLIVVLLGPVRCGPIDAAGCWSGADGVAGGVAAGVAAEVPIALDGGVDSTGTAGMLAALGAAEAAGSGAAACCWELDAATAVAGTISTLVPHSRQNFALSGSADPQF